MTRLLHDNITEGTGTAAYTGCAGQAGKTGTTDELHRRLVRRLPAQPGDRGLGRLPASRTTIAMTSVHGITVFGGTFPAEIWHSLYADGGVPCEEFERAGEADQLGALLRPVHRRPSPSDDGTAPAARRRRRRAKPPPGSAAVGGYDPDAYAPGRRARNRRRCHRRRRRRQPEAAVGGGESAGGEAGSRASTPGLAYRPDLGRLRSPTSACSPRRRGSGGGSSGARSSSSSPPSPLAPVLLSHDVYSYVDYARLGVVHGLDPYVHPPAAAPADPAFADVTWTEATSAYGPLFTLATYPLAWLPVGVAVAVLKAVAALSVLGLAALVARLAAWRGVDPLRAAAFVALNPLVLVHVVGGAHNDGLAMLLAMLGVAAVLSAREARGRRRPRRRASRSRPRPLFVAPFALLATAPPTGRSRR